MGWLMTRFKSDSVRKGLESHGLRGHLKSSIHDFFFMELLLERVCIFRLSNLKFPPDGANVETSSSLAEVLGSVLINLISLEQTCVIRSRVPKDSRGIPSDPDMMLK